MLLALAVAEAAAGAGLLRLRQRVVGEWADARGAVAGAITLAALIVGTGAAVSGVVLTVPVIAAMGWALRRSLWRPGDTALLVLITALGAAVGYQVAAILDPDTGSYGDQGAILLAMVAVPVVVVATISARRRLATSAAGSARRGDGPDRGSPSVPWGPSVPSDR